MDFSSIDGLEFEGVNPPKEVDDNSSQDQAISFSNKIMGMLEIKTSEHNENHPKNNAGLHQLKEVFRRGTENCLEDQSCVEIGLARVNMFLRLVKGEKIEISNASLKNETIDISSNLSLTEEDFEQAKADIEKHDLNFNFRTSDDLFLENDPDFKWEL